MRRDVQIASRDDRVPAILLTPEEASRRPGVLLLHGLGSQKERMADTIGEALLRRGIASLAVDLPLHGARVAASVGMQSGNPLELIRNWRTAVEEARMAIEYLSEHPRIQSDRLGIVGYSLGSFLANVVAADAPQVRAMVLAASGDLPDGIQFESFVRAVVDPIRVIRAASGRPLLMINGRSDRTVKPAQAERLFAAAREPKTLRWYAGGHWPPPKEIEFAADWLLERFG